MVTQRPRDPATESFAGLLLRHRGRTGLTQRDVAARLGTTRRSVQDWESGAYYPSAERLQARTGELVASGGLDGTVKLWETASCTLMCTLRSDRRFERMDISRLTGVTQEQRSVLLALGAVEA